MIAVVNSQNILLEVASKASINAQGGNETDVSVYFNYEDGSVKFVDIVDAVPSGVKPILYCYETGKGFYLNPNYEAPIALEDRAKNADKKAVDLQKQMAQVLLALAKANIKV